MQEVNSMTQQELTNYFVKKKMKGASFRELSNLFDKYQINSETRKLIMVKLDEMDKKQKVLLDKNEKANKRNSGLKSLVIGLGVIIFGILLYISTAKSGVIFIFNFVVWGFGCLLILRGLMNFLESLKK